ncbi:hypothetical protein TNCV_3403351 [Trichonephila clavipes]|nr:hypothetical protein TNCV_3403351 [Trichonephila clavipes]
MDDLLYQAKLTPFMSTLDLRAGYHQVKVHVESRQDSICMSFFTVSSRMSYGFAQRTCYVSETDERFVMSGRHSSTTLSRLYNCFVRNF